jgi:hypothetical protein
MTKILTTLGAIAGLSMTIASMPAQAAPSCWADREVSAARVRQMQTMLMVAALRCRAGGIDIVADYDGFVTAQHDQIVAANLVIKQHFAQAGGNQVDYDRFATSLANGYGDAETNQGTCAEAAAMAHEGSAATAAALQQVASARLFPAALPGGPCAAPAGTTLAAVTAPTPVPAEEAPAPILMLAAAFPAAPAAPPPVTLPNDVIAALTVLARYHAAQPMLASATVAPTQIAAVAH